MVSVDTSGGSVTSNDVNVAIPKWFSYFWDGVNDDGDDIRVTSADGISELTYQLTDAAFTGSWDKANRDAGIQVDNALFDGNEDCGVIWIYWGNAAASAGAGSFTPSSAITGRIAGAEPSSPVEPSKYSPGDATPAVTVGKTTAETKWVWTSLASLVHRAARHSQGRLGHEGIVGVSYAVYQGASSQAAMEDAAGLRLMESAAGDVYARIPVKAGSDDTDYTIRLTVYTSTDTSSAGTAEQTLDTRILLKVKDPSES